VCVCVCLFWCRAIPWWSDEILDEIHFQYEKDTLGIYRHIVRRLKDKMLFNEITCVTIKQTIKVQINFQTLSAYQLKSKKLFSIRSWNVSIISPVFSVTWSFRNHDDLLLKKHFCIFHQFKECPKCRFSNN